MPPVTCYVCGRDFGSKSIGIHLPSCKKKWETAQEKLPKSERKPVPVAPSNFEKVLKGEIKGKELVKINKEALTEHNDSGLEACQFCGRTFVQKALMSHQKACTQEKPMMKNKGPGHTSQLKSKVNYPKPKPKGGAKKNTKGKQENKCKNEIKEVINVPEEEEKPESLDTFNLVEKVPTSVKAKPPLLAGGSSRVHGVYGLLPKEAKDKIKVGAENEEPIEENKNERKTANTQGHPQDNSSKTINTEPSKPTTEKTKEEELLNVSEEDWILVNPQATREFIDDIKQKILQCVTNSPPNEDNKIEEDDQSSPQLEDILSSTEEVNEIDSDNPDHQLEDTVLLSPDESETETRITQHSDDLTSENELNNAEQISEENSIRAENEGFSNNSSNRNSIADQKYKEDEYSEEGSKLTEEEAPTRNEIIDYISKEPLYDEEEHRVNIMDLITDYVKNIKRMQILEIYDNHVFEDEDSIEDAVFRMSEILYTK